MVLRILRFLAVLAVGLFALRALAHQIECEKDVGVVRLDAQGNPAVGTDGLPVFLSAPSPLLALDTYPAAVGWRVRLNNLASETSIVSAFDDPYLASTTAGFEVFGTVPTAGTAIPVGGSTEVVFVERIDSYAQCVGAPQSIVPVEGGPTCPAARENVVGVVTHADASSCRAKILCLPPTTPPTPELPPDYQPL